MADVRVVLVNGDVFAVCTTEPNAVMLRDKINKLYVDDPAELSDTAALYNPKHSVAEEKLDGMWLRRKVDAGAPAASVAAPAKTSAARGRGRRAA